VVNKVSTVGKNTVKAKKKKKLIEICRNELIIIEGRAAERGGEGGGVSGPAHEQNK